MPVDLGEVRAQLGALARPGWLDLAAPSALARLGWLDLAAQSALARPGWLDLGQQRAGWLDLAANARPGRPATPGWLDLAANECPNDCPFDTISKKISMCSRTSCLDAACFARSATFLSCLKSSRVYTLQI